MLYGHDRQHAQNAAVDLASFVDELEANQDIAHIHIIAHSMGAYAFCMALLQHKADAGKSYTKISDVTFAAPDVAVDQLQTSFDTLLQHTTKAITVYVSSKDVAMQGSIQWNGSRPLGDGVPPLFLLLGYAFVDASGVDTDFLGHGYFVDQDAILNDMARTFNGEAYPRPLVHPLQQSGITYYTF